MLTQPLISGVTAALGVLLGTKGIRAQEDQGTVPDFDRVNVSFPLDSEGTIFFYVAEATLPNARQGDSYSQRISGLVQDGDSDENITFSASSDYADWVSVSEDGVISGTPGPDDTETTIEIRASGSDSGAEASATFTIPVRPSGSPLLDRLAAMSFNMWHGGTQINNYHEKQVRFILSSGADVVGLQEDQEGRHTTRLADALGWHHWSGESAGLGVLSKYPIEEEYGVVNRSGGVRIALDGEDQQLNLWVVHLGYTPYGPYDFCFDDMTTEEVLEREAESGRTGQVTDTLEAMEDQIDDADNVALLLLGDFNAPSHLDWIEELGEKNCGHWNVPWPTSELPTEAGLNDSYRVAHPDPAEKQGITWTPLFPENEDEGRPEPHDRIDFIYYKGTALSVRDSRAVVVGNPEPSPDYEDNEWTSDHAAVLTTYDLTT